MRWLSGLSHLLPSLMTRVQSSGLIYGERPNLCKLSSDLHRHAVAHVYTHTRTLRETDRDTERIRDREIETGKNRDREKERDRAKTSNGDVPESDGRRLECVS